MQRAADLDEVGLAIWAARPAALNSCFAFVRLWRRPASWQHGVSG